MARKSASYGHRKPRPGFRWLIALVAALSLLALFAFSPFTASLRALAVMSVYDSSCEKSSLPAAVGLAVDMPIAEHGFFPVMVTFNEDAGMSDWLDKPVRFTVDYAVAGYPFLSSHSGFYDPDDPLYGAYVGAYYLRGLDRPADEQTVMRITEFDQRCLALPAVGLEADKAVFRVDDVKATAPQVQMAGYDWQRYDAAIATNGPGYTKTRFHTGYLLFGDPPPAVEQYPLRQMAGRIYVTYFEGTDLTVGLYILAKDESVLDKIDANILSKARMTWKPTK